jgi:hypothetical protein
MQREKLYNWHTTANFTVTFFVLKIDKVLSDRILTLREVIAWNFVSFETKNTTVK